MCIFTEEFLYIYRNMCIFTEELHAFFLSIHILLIPQSILFDIVIPFLISISGNNC